MTLDASVMFCCSGPFSVIVIGIRFCGIARAVVWLFDDVKEPSEDIIAVVGFDVVVEIRFRDRFAEQVAVAE